MASKRKTPPERGKWYFDTESGNSVTIVSISDEKHWWEHKDGSRFYCDPLDWYLWGRFT